MQKLRKAMPTTRRGSNAQRLAADAGGMVLVVSPVVGVGVAGARLSQPAATNISAAIAARTRARGCLDMISISNQTVVTPPGKRSAHRHGVASYTAASPRPMERATARI
jgi:hypothetical protein